MADSSSLNTVLSVGILLLAFVNVSYSSGLKIKTSTFLSPKFELGPGSVVNRYYHNINFPRGHIAIKSFFAEVIDEAGTPIPLYETYLHHWLVKKYFQRNSSDSTLSARNDGICQGTTLGQYFGLGSETRKTDNSVPDPYGIEIGNPDEIPEGYEEKWLLNVHAIDTRGVEDRIGCTECKCDLYNITVDEYGNPLRPDYKGGLFCCYDQTECKLRKGFHGPKRSLYMKYTVKWVNWESSIIPVNVYILDVTDDGIRYNNDSLVDHRPYGCRVEYDVEPCQANSRRMAAADGFVDAKRTSVVMPNGGFVVYVVAHQHAGGIGSTLYGQNGRIICTSIPTYEEGKEAGNESGYIVGMSSCYPNPGSVKIANGEKLTIESNYTKITRTRTGVMRIFYLLVANKLSDPLQNSNIDHQGRPWTWVREASV